MNLEKINLAKFLDKISLLNEHLFYKQAALVLIYAVLAKIVDVFINKILRKIADKTKITYDNKLIDLLHSPIYWSVFAIGLLHAMSLNVSPPSYQNVLIEIIKSVILLLWVITAVRIINLSFDSVLVHSTRREKVGKDITLLTKKVVRIVVIVVGINWLLVIWEVNLTPLFASAGIAGIAVAMAAKDSLANFFGGVSLFMDRTFNVGDYVIIDNDKRGEVMEVGIRSTRIKTRDDIMVTIPNSILATSTIVNESAPVPRFRIRVPVGVAYGSDLDFVEKIILSVVNANPNVSRNPEPRVRLRAFGASSVDFELLVWVNDPREKGLEIHNLLKAIYKKFSDEEISIPFPQLDVHLPAAENQKTEDGRQRTDTGGRN